MKVEEFDAKKFDVKKFDEILARGLSNGLGVQGSQVCIEAAICETLGLPHGDDPGCVGAAVRAFKISLNDSRWSSPKARAEGMRDLGLAQLGSKDSVNDVEFVKRLSEKLIRVLVPKLFRQIFPENGVCLAAVDRCEKEGTLDAAASAAEQASAANAAYAANAAAYAANAAAYAASAAYAAKAAAYAANAANAAASAASAAYAANAADEYLKLAAEIALETLREMESPGVVLIG